MTSLVNRVARFFVAPAEATGFAPPAPAFEPPRARPAMAGVLAAEADLPVAAGAVAASLRRDSRSPAALVCVWRGHDEPPLAAPAPGAPAALRLSGKLARRGLAARVCGALCVVELPCDPEAAVTVFRDAAAAADAPAVLALARRDPAFDPLLGSAERMVLGAGAGSDPVLAELALAGLRALGPPCQRIEVPCRLVARQTARLGLARRSKDAPAELPGRTALQEGAS